MLLFAIEVKAPRMVFNCGFLTEVGIDFSMLVVLVDMSIVGLISIRTFICFSCILSDGRMMVGVAEILDFCDFLSPTPEEKSARNAAIESVFGVIKYIWPKCKVWLVVPLSFFNFLFIRKIGIWGSMIYLLHCR